MAEKCPICGNEMFLLYGCHWDYDRWVCHHKIGSMKFCPGEIELDTTTCPEGFEDD